MSPERQESCGPGQQRLASKCGKRKRKKKTAKAVGMRKERIEEPLAHYLQAFSATAA